MTETPIGPASKWELPRLGADAADAEAKVELSLFGRFVGDWEILDNRFLKPDGSWGHLVGELHWRWILRGRALQDVWTLFHKETGELAYEGSTIRIYDRRRGVWSSIWVSATHGRVRSFTAHAEGDRIVLDEQVLPGHPQERWVFCDIGPEAFRWYAEEAEAEGTGWTLTEEMQIRRTVRPVP